MFDFWKRLMWPVYEVWLTGFDEKETKDKRIIRAKDATYAAQYFLWLTTIDIEQAIKDESLFLIVFELRGSSQVNKAYWMTQDKMFKFQIKQAEKNKNLKLKEL